MKVHDPLAFAPDQVCVVAFDPDPPIFGRILRLSVADLRAARHAAAEKGTAKLGHDVSVALEGDAATVRPSVPPPRSAGSRPFLILVSFENVERAPHRRLQDPPLCRSQRETIRTIVRRDDSKKATKPSSRLAGTSVRLAELH